jgi:iron complex outermembrane receptor protein
MPRPTPPLRLLWFLTLLCVPGLRAYSADAGRRAFNLPADDAENALRLFATQSGLEVLFSRPSTAGVRTPALQGDYAPLEAINRLLAGTPLVATPEPRSGAIVVSRPRAAAQPAPGRDPGSPAEPPTQLMTNPHKSPRLLLASLAGWLAASTPAAAQTAPGSPSAAGTAAKETIKLESFVVTGSNIPTAADAVAVPVTVINREEIERTGLGSNLLEVVQTRMPSFAGSGNLGATNGNIAGGNATSGGSQLSLRNLSTLVLLDGRRLPDSGASARGGRSFVDVNQIPLAAIQSMEVLTDGASAIYGSDAVGGVVNVKLKHDYQGLEIGGRYAMSTADGDYSQRSAYLVAGANTERMSVTVSLSQSRITPLLQSERPFSNPQRGKSATISGALGQSSTAFPTAFLRPGLNSPQPRHRDRARGGLCRSERLGRLRHLSSLLRPADRRYLRSRAVRHAHPPIPQKRDHAGEHAQAHPRPTRAVRRGHGLLER